jgi:gliding motility-associated-like protein
VKSLGSPIVHFRPDSCICTGDSIELYAGMVDPYTSFLWNDNSTGNSITVLDEAVYWVNVVNPCGSASDTVEICFRTCEPLVWVPNAFSPNNDGKNDLFKARGQNITNFRMHVYNKWGELIFTSNSLDAGWNGMHNGTNCPVGSYVYLIHYESVAIEPPVVDNMKGIVLLLK